MVPQIHVFVFTYYPENDHIQLFALIQLFTVQKRNGTNAVGIVIYLEIVSSCYKAASADPDSVQHLTYCLVSKLSFIYSPELAKTTEFQLSPFEVRPRLPFCTR